MNKKLRIMRSHDGEKQDRLSSLPDELIHLVLSFLGIRLAVQLSVLSKRWKHIWSTLPFLSLDWYDQLFPYTHSSIIKFMDNFFLKRNHQTHIFSFKLFAVYPFPPSFLKRLLNYLNEHNVQELDIDLVFHRYSPFKQATFSSRSMKKLKLRVPLDFSKSLESDCLWDLPVLTNLHLICPPHMSNYKLPKSSLIYLPVLTTLCLDCVELPELLSSFSLPALKTLIMKRCKLPETIWDLPALLSIELDDVLLPENKIDFSTLVTLQDLTLNFSNTIMKYCFISCPQLVNLRISKSLRTPITFNCEIVVVAPKLRCLYCVGIFPVTLNAQELENVSIKFWDTNGFKDVLMSYKSFYHCRVVKMFSKLGRAKILTLDSATFEALAAISDFFECVPSPFHDLKYVKAPQGYEVSSISTTLRKYLLGGNPSATIVTTLPQVVPISPTGATPQKVKVDEPLEIPTKKLVDPRDIHKKVSLDTVERMVQAVHLVENSVVDAGRVRHVDFSVAGKLNRGRGDIGSTRSL